MFSLQVAPLSSDGWFSIFSHKFLSSSTGNTENVVSEKLTETTKKASAGSSEKSTETANEASAGNSEKVPEKSTETTKEEGRTGSSDGTGSTGKSIRGSVSSHNYQL